jgi:hypothetical protein
MWDKRRHDAAARIQPILAGVFDYATAHGLRQGDNPASWKIIRHLAPARPNGEQKRHAALDWKEDAGLHDEAPGDADDGRARARIRHPKGTGRSPSPSPTPVAAPALRLSGGWREAGRIGQPEG